MLVFEWDEIPCGSRRGSIIQYHYELYNDDDMMVTDGNVTSRYVLLEMLTACSVYKFQVAAWTSIGNGPYSEHFTTNTSISGKRNNTPFDHSIGFREIWRGLGQQGRGRNVLIVKHI